MLTASGQMIGERDLQIAATAIASGHELMALNLREFERIPGLTLRPY
jgi:predicted nucleic acid-binding protein